MKEESVKVWRSIVHAKSKLHATTKENSQKTKCLWNTLLYIFSRWLNSTLNKVTNRHIITGMLHQRLVIASATSHSHFENQMNVSDMMCRRVHKLHIALPLIRRETDPLRRAPKMWSDCPRLERANNGKCEAHSRVCAGISLMIKGSMVQRQVCRAIQTQSDVLMMLLMPHRLAAELVK